MFFIKWLHARKIRKFYTLMHWCDTSDCLELIAHQCPTELKEEFLARHQFLVDQENYEHSKKPNKS